MFVPAWFEEGFNRIKHCFFYHVTIIFENNVAKVLIVANFQAVCGTEIQNFKNALVLLLFKIKFISCVKNIIGLKILYIN